MCLEEMYGVPVPEGAFFYGGTRRRTIVAFTDILRNAVVTTASQMHRVWEAGVLPPPLADQRPCDSCSLVDLCLLSPSDQRRLRRVAKSCHDYGQRVQNSVFECSLTEAQLTLLRQRISREIDPLADTVRFYVLHRNKSGPDFVLGKETSYQVDAPLII